MSNYRLISGALAAAALLPSSFAFGAAFSLLEQSGGNLGTAFSGTGAVADDVAAIYFNPAALATLERPQVAASVSAIDLTTRFHDSASAAAFGQALGNEGGNAGGWNWVPAVYAGARIAPDVYAGLAVNAPFGLKTNYDGNWIGRFQALKSEVKTLNVNPALAFRLGPHVTFAAGVDYQHLQAELGSAVNYSAVVAQGVQQLAIAGQLPPSAAPGIIAANAGLQGQSTVRGDDSAWGYNLGLLLELPTNTRIGLAYRSTITYHVEGDVTFTAPTASQPTGGAIIAAAGAPGGPLSAGSTRLDLKMPDSATLSLAQSLTSQLQLLADVAWTGWNSIQEIRIVRDTAAVVAVTPERWKETWRFALGADYQLNPQWKLRGGVAWDASPVPNETRTPRLPDNDRTWVAIGTQWRPLTAVAVDLSYAHLFARAAALNQAESNPAAYGLLLGEQQSHVDIVGLQASYRF